MTLSHSINLFCTWSFQITFPLNTNALKIQVFAPAGTHPGGSFYTQRRAANTNVEFRASRLNMRKAGLVMVGLDKKDHAHHLCDPECHISSPLPLVHRVLGKRIPPRKQKKVLMASTDVLIFSYIQTTILQFEANKWNLKKIDQRAYELTKPTRFDVCIIN